jgi:hypothetical protein
MTYFSEGKTMQHWDTIWSFETARFRVTCDVTPEDTDPADCFDNDDDVEMVRSGAVDWFTARLRVTLDGAEIATDYLGACAYACAADFARKDRDGYFRDMVRSAIADARRALADMPKMRKA